MGVRGKLPLLLLEVKASNNFRQLKLPQSRSVEADKSFHIPLEASTYFHEFPKLSLTFTRAH